MVKTYILPKQEFSKVSELDDEDRVKHFLDRVGDWQRVWGLRGESGWVTVTDDDGNACFPVWPHHDYANVCAVGEWADSMPEAIELEKFVSECLVSFVLKVQSLAVFPTPLKKGIIVDPIELQEQLIEEMSRYE